jgi:hypothetical protein
MMLELGITAVCWAVGVYILAKPPYDDYALWWQPAQDAMRKVGR